MRKLLSVFLIFAFAVSLFDIVDTEDFKLGTKEIFSSDNAYANDCDEDMDELSYNFTAHASSSFLVILPEKIVPQLSVVQISQNFVMLYQQSFSAFIPGNLYRPPII